MSFRNWIDLHCVATGRLTATEPSLISAAAVRRRGTTRTASVFLLIAERCDRSLGLEWEPSVNAAHIGVSANSGVVTLTGHVDSYTQKLAAEKAAGRVEGVKAVAEELEVRYSFEPPDDSDIAKSALQALSSDFEVPKDSVAVKVDKGWVTLSGNVDWYYQSNAAGGDVRKLRGVVGVTNDIKIKPKV